MKGGACSIGWTVTNGSESFATARSSPMRPPESLTLSGVIPSEHEENCFDSRLMIDIAMVGQLMPEPV
jgi:hypothetical protein